MAVGVKICGLTDAASVEAVAAGGARYAGFVFFDKSPRALAPDRAAALIAQLPAQTESVGLFVDAGDDEIRHVLSIAPLRLLQLHGRETPERVADLRRQTGLPVIKAVGIAQSADLDLAMSYQRVADFLLLDAKPPKDSHLPGGNAMPFDWTLLQGMRLQKPWLLAGGLRVDNLAGAVAATHAPVVDVSSGVEDAPGVKNPAKIAAFLDLAAHLETSY